MWLLVRNVVGILHLSIWVLMLMLLVLWKHYWLHHVVWVVACGVAAYGVIAYHVGVMVLFDCKYEYICEYMYICIYIYTQVYILLCKEMRRPTSEKFEFSQEKNKNSQNSGPLIKFADIKDTSLAQANSAVGLERTCKCTFNNSDTGDSTGL